MHSRAGDRTVAASQPLTQVDASRRRNFSTAPNVSETSAGFIAATATRDRALSYGLSRSVSAFTFFPILESCQPMP